MAADDHKKPVINFLVFWVGQYCTLRCKNCVNLMPYTKHFHYDVRKSLIDLKKISAHARIKKLQIQGGEPLTHPELHLLISEVDKLPIDNIDIATNGTVLLTSHLLQALQQAKRVRVRISYYPNVKRRREKFIQQLIDNDIKWSEYAFMYGDASWFDSGSVDVARNDIEESVSKIYKDCENKTCWTLADGILAVCGKVHMLKELRNVTEPVMYNEIDIRNMSSKGELIKGIEGFIANKGRYREACRYCLGTYKKVPSAIQTDQAEILQELEKLSKLE